MTRKYFVTLLTVLLATIVVAAGVLASGSTPARDFTESGTVNQSQSEYVIVTFKDPPTASYEGEIPGLARTKPERGQKLSPADPAVVDYVAHLSQVHQDYRNYLANKAPKAEVVDEFFYVTNSLAIKMNGARPQTLAQGPGVRSVTYSGLYRPTMNVSVDLIGASALWPAANSRENAGAGIKVGIIDTGIDPDHDFFGCKEEIPAKVYASGVAFDPSNVVVFDHGTHVAGIVAGCVTELTEGPIIGTISGVAPAAELWDYNVFPGFGAGFVAFGGSALSHDIIAALEDTVLDGMDVVNMSLGGGVQGPNDPLSEAVNATANAGVVVAVAAGNSGPGDSTINSPGDAAKALTAGATTNAHVVVLFVDVTPEIGDPASYQAATGDFDPYDDSPAFDVSLVDWADTGGDVTACDPAPDASPVVGKIALISRGDCTFTTKIRNAENAGAFGVVVYNNVAGPPIGMGHDGTDPFPVISAVMVSDSDGAAILASLPATATIVGPGEELPADPDIIAGFSSRGPTSYNYQIKPDVTAPGVNVYSAVFNNEFAMFSGTSMAAPHLAGSAALLLHLHPDWSPEDVKSALVNTAARVVLDHETATEDPGVLARGGGRIDLEAAHNTPLTFDPVSASFGLWTGNKYVSDSLDLAVFNVSDTAQSCEVGVTGPAIVTAFPTEFSVAAGESATVTLALDAGRSNQTPSGDYDGDVVVTCDDTELRAAWWVRIDRRANP
jgi:minor extracellular serine protease Vpr